MSHIAIENCNQIITNLYLGGITAGLQTQNLLDQGVRAVVCCLRELEFPECDFHKDLEYYRVDVEDIGVEPIDLFWPEATAFIHSFLSSGQPVLVHCRAGVSRSPSTVIAYLIEYKGYSLLDAFTLARSHRPVVTPNMGFMHKLLDFEASHRATSPTLSMQKYVSWFNGSQLEDVLDVGVEDAVDADTAASTSASTPTLVEDAPEPANVAAESKLPEAMERQTSAEKLKAAVRKVNVINAIARRPPILVMYDDDIDDDLDLHDAADGSAVLPPAGTQRRLEIIRQMLVRHVAQDQELGYCQGMHLTASVFAAASHTRSEAYWRFNAFVGSIRGLWLPGFPLLSAGVSQFEKLASNRPWFQHFLAHLIEPSAYLPQAWLAFFTTWLPLQTLVESLDFLEGNGFAGILAMTLALLDGAGAELVKQQSDTDILQTLQGLKNLAPSATALMNDMRQWLPKVHKLLAASFALVVSQPIRQDDNSNEFAAVLTSKGKRELIRCRRRGSRVLDESGNNLLFDAPAVRTMVMDEGVKAMPVPLSWCTPDKPHSEAQSCWSWCWPFAQSTRISEFSFNSNSLRLSGCDDSVSPCSSHPRLSVRGDLQKKARKSVVSQVARDDHKRECARQLRASLNWSDREM